MKADKLCIDGEGVARQVIIRDQGDRYETDVGCEDKD
jgi:hypothetical protein